VGGLKRVSITPSGLEHGANPIPAASRRGPMLATGGVRGVDRRTGGMPDAVEEQVALMFTNLGDILAAGGAGWDDIVKMTFWVAAPEARPAINAAWLERFPDADSRPARHLLNYDLAHGMLVQCDALAFVTSETPHG